MNKSIITLMMVAAAFSATAQSKLDISAMRIMDEYRTMQSGGPQATMKRVRSKAAAELTSQQGPVSMIILLNDGATEADLEGVGCEISDMGDGVALAKCHLSNVEALCALPCVKHVSFGGKQSISMVETRKDIGVDMIHQGYTYNTDNGDVTLQPFTGKGVLLGVIDLGFDINHLNFLDENGESRFESFWNMYSDNGSYNQLNTPDAIKAFRSDYLLDVHGTHTSGIAGGSYRGPIDYYDGETDTDMEDVDNPFYGIAPDATLLGSGGQLYDANIAEGLKVLSEYAANQDKKLVLNMSFGSGLGPHDGSSALCQTIAKYAKNNIFCLATGNDGESKMGITKKFTATDNEFTTGLSFSYDQQIPETHCQFWSDDETPFELTMLVADSFGKILCEVPVATEGQTVMATRKFNVPTYYYPQAFCDGFANGCSISALGQKDSASGRYYVDLQYTLVRNSSVYYQIGFRVKGQENHTVWGYTANYKHKFSNFSFSGWTDGSTDGTMSDLSTSDNVICVGAYATNDHYYTYDGSLTNYYPIFEKGDICYFSSYGTMPNGRTVPDICAPGAFVVSSVSRHYNISDEAWNRGSNYNPPSNDYTAMARGADRRANFWQQQSGTSMATPVVTGVMALCLQANEDLDVETAREIITKTAKRDRFVDNGIPAQWGSGKINAAACVAEAYRRANGVINPVVPGTDDDMRLIISTVGNRLYEVFVHGEQTLNATLVSMNGAVALNAAADGDTVTIDASGVTPGVYVLNIKGADTNYSKKVVIR